MDTINKAVLQFMKDHYYHYWNPHHVEILLFDDHSLGVCASWWVDKTNEHNYIHLTADYNCTELVKIFGIESLTQIELLAPDMLYEKYKSGHVAVCCSIDEPGNYYSLSFRIKHNGLWATDNRNDSHKVSMPLATPAEFMEYTRQRLLLTRLKKEYLD